jgi:hypothetical protein
MADDRYEPFADGDDSDDEDDDFEGEDDSEDDDEDDEGDDDGPQRPAVFITTSQAVPLDVQRLDDERAPDGVALGAYIGGRLVARSAMPGEAIDRLLALGLFTEPVPLGLFAYEEEPGLQCRLFALVPSGLLSAASHADEPWKASVPSYEDRVAEGDDDEASRSRPCCSATSCASPATASTRRPRRRGRGRAAQDPHRRPARRRQQQGHRRPAERAVGRAGTRAGPRDASRGPAVRGGVAARR